MLSGGPINDVVFESGCITAMLVAGVLGWVFAWKPARVPRTLRRSLLIAARVTMVSGLLLCITWFGLDLPPRTLIPFICIALVVVLLASENLLIEDNAVSFALSATLLTPLYVVKQFILGFPDRELWFWSPDDLEEPDPVDELDWQDAVVVVASPLRPMGTIDFGGQTLPAKSAGGSFIEAGAEVRILDRKNSVFLVEEELQSRS